MVNANREEDLNNPNDYFEGEVTMRFRLTRPANRIVFHAARSLEIMKSITLENANTGAPVTVDSSSHNYIHSDLYQIVLSSDLPVAVYRLKVMFKGKFAPRETEGLYKASFQFDYLGRLF
jgi:hypothetical protein